MFYSDEDLSVVYQFDRAKTKLIQRYVSIQRELIDNPGIAVGGLAEKLSLKEETIRNVIDDLKMAGGIIREKEEKLYCDMAVWEV